MVSITPAQRAQNALKLSAWIASQHPELFRQLVTKLSALQRSPLGRFGYFGDDAAIADLTFTPDLPAYQITPDVNIDSSAAYTPDLSSVSTDAALADTGSLSQVSDSLTQAISTPSTTTDTAAPAESSSFWGSIGSGVANMASSVAKVAGALVSPQSIAAVGGVAAAYFTAKGKTSSTAAQNAVLQTQLARTSSGASPAAISYVRDPTTGALTPVYNSASGQSQVTGSLLNALSNPTIAGSTAGIPNTYLLIGGGLLVLTVLLAGRK